MLRGLSNVSYYADDLEAATAWYTQVLGVAPYYEVTGYREWRIGDDEDELGLIDAAYAPPGAADAPGRSVVSWHVDDLEATVERLVGLGATLRDPVTERGEGFRTAVLLDPFGNGLGVMENPHWRARHE